MSGLLFVISLFVLRRKRPASAPITFIFLLLCHVIFGCGYLFIAMYRHWSWGERYLLWSHVDLTEAVYVYVFMISMTLFLLSYLRFRSSVTRNADSAFRFRPFSKSEFLIILLCVSLYIAGLKFGTLRVGIGASVVLPFRLNGIIEIVTLYLFPLYITLNVQRMRAGFWIGMAIIALYGVMNLASSGSKNSAVYPLVVFTSVAFLCGRLKGARILIPTLLVVSLYTLINPWYFREVIRSGGVESSSFQLLAESSQLVKSGGMAAAPLRHGLLSLRNLSHRMSGIIPMQCAIDISLPVWNAIVSHDFIMDVTRYYNEQVVYTPLWTSNAPGHFGYFMIMFGNHILGFCTGWLLLMLYFIICLRFDRNVSKFNSQKDVLIGLSFVVMLVPFLLDGNYDNSSCYLHLMFSLLAIRFLFLRLLLSDGLPTKKISAKSQVTEFVTDVQVAPSRIPSP